MCSQSVPGQSERFWSFLVPGKERCFSRTQTHREINPLLFQVCLGFEEAYWLWSTRIILGRVGCEFTLRTQNLWNKPGRVHSKVTLFCCILKKKNLLKHSYTNKYVHSSSLYNPKKKGQNGDWCSMNPVCECPCGELSFPLLGTFMTSGLTLGQIGENPGVTWLQTELISVSITLWHLVTQRLELHRDVHCARTPRLSSEVFDIFRPNWEEFGFFYYCSCCVSLCEI